MSEVNSTPSSIDDGIPEVTFDLEVQGVVQAPIDPTLTIEGMAADAKATGEAIAAAKTDLEEQIQDIIINVSGVADLLFPVGCIYTSTSATAPTFGKSTWRWQEIMLPVTYGNLMDGSRDYKAKESLDVPGTLHFWMRIADAEG